jgi:hypothetical protein
MKTFKEGILETYDAEELREIADHGCINCAPGGLIYYTETVKAYESYLDEIWDKLHDIKDSLGGSAVLEIISSFTSAKDIIDDTQFKNMLVWFYVEEIAREKEGE